MDVFCEDFLFVVCLLHVILAEDVDCKCSPAYFAVNCIPIAKCKTKRSDIYCFCVTTVLTVGEVHLALFHISWPVSFHILQIPPGRHLLVLIMNGL